MESSQEQWNNLPISRADVEHIRTEVKFRIPQKKSISYNREWLKKVRISRSYVKWIKDFQGVSELTSHSIWQGLL